MSPITHFSIGWSVTTRSNLGLKERVLITIAGIAPDIEGAGLILDILSLRHDAPYRLWGEHHHISEYSEGQNSSYRLSGTKRWC